MPRGARYTSPVVRIHNFSVLVEQVEGSFRAWCPCLLELGADARGEDQTEAFLNLHEAVLAIFDMLRQEDKPLPDRYGEYYDGVRATITVIEECNVEDLTFLGLPTSGGVRPVKPNPKDKKKP